MAVAREPRPRRLAGAFGAYVLILVGLAFYLSPTIAGYVDPGATFWICAAYVLLGALALAGICAGAVARARSLDARVDDLEVVRRSRPIPTPTRQATTEVTTAPVLTPVDSGSADHEVDALLDSLQRMSDAASSEAHARPESGAGLELEPRFVEDLRMPDAREIERLRAARDAVAVTVLGPALAAIALVGAFATLLPGSDGMLLANLQLNAFVGVAGLGSLVGLGAYAAAAFRQIRRRAP